MTRPMRYLTTLMKTKIKTLVGRDIGGTSIAIRRVNSARVTMRMKPAKLVLEDKQPSLGGEISWTTRIPCPWTLGQIVVWQLQTCERAKMVRMISGLVPVGAIGL